MDDGFDRGYYDALNAIREHLPRITGHCETEIVLGCEACDWLAGNGVAWDDHVLVTIPDYVAPEPYRGPVTPPRVHGKVGTITGPAIIGTNDTMNAGSAKHIRRSAAATEYLFDLLHRNALCDHPAAFRRKSGRCGVCGLADLT